MTVHVVAICQGCGRELDQWLQWIADGCDCNSPRGINHGLVPVDVCTCVGCDPEQTGASRANITSMRRRIDELEAQPEALPPVAEQLLIDLAEMRARSEAMSNAFAAASLSPAVDQLPIDLAEMDIVLDVLKRRIDELEAENAKLRAALEADADALRIAANDCTATKDFDATTRRYTARSKTRAHCVDAMRACWAALGKWPL